MYGKITYRFESIRLAHDRVYISMHDLAEAIPDFYFLPGETFTFDNGITVSLKVSKFPGVNIPNKGGEDEDSHAYLSILYSDYLQCKNEHDASALAHFLAEKFSDNKRQSIAGANLAPIILNSKLTRAMERIDRPDSIDIAFFNRPGRFEEAIYLGYPEWPEIEKFMESRGCSDLALKEYTHELNFAHLNELIYRVKINKEDPKTAYGEIKRLDSVKKLNTEKDPEKKSKVEFGEL